VPQHNQSTAKHESTTIFVRKALGDAVEEEAEPELELLVG